MQQKEGTSTFQNDDSKMDISIYLEQFREVLNQDRFELVSAKLSGKSFFNCCKPVFELIHELFKMFENIDSKLQEPLFNLIIETFEILNSPNIDFVRLEVSLFMFSVKINTLNEVQVMSAIKCQKDLLAFSLEQNSMLNIQAEYFSGKSIIIPTIFMLKSFLGSLPYFVMTESRKSQIKEIVTFFKNTFNFQVTSNPDKLKEMNGKPCVLVLDPFSAVSFVSSSSPDLLSKCVFCIDEFHERKVDNDILYSIVKNEAPLVLMSTAPDPHFGSPQIICNHDSKYEFEIQKIKIQENESVFEATTSTLKGVLLDMRDEIIEKGSILVFTPDDYSASEIISYLHNQNDITTLNLAPNVDFIDFNNNDNQNEFQNLDEYLTTMKKSIENSDDPNFVILPVKMTDQLNGWQNQITYNNLSDFPNVVKVIFVSNVTDIMFKVQGLKVVIDMRSYRSIKTDEELGISYVNYLPITKAIKEQRKNIISNYPSGFYVQIISSKLIDSFQSEIETVDLRQKTLTLRALGIKIEDIELPSKPTEQIQECINYLSEKNFIDSNGNLTENGKEFSKFGQISPIILESILVYSEQNEGRLFAALISLICANCDNSSILFGDDKFFCPESDIVTIIRIFINNFTTGYGISKNVYEEIKHQLKNISRNIYGLNRKSSEIKKDLENYINGKDLLEEINVFVDIVLNKKEAWKDSIFGQFIEYKNNDIFYEGDPCLNSSIHVISRPLCKQDLIPIPTDSLFFKIMVYPNNKIIGSIIHMDGGSIIPEAFDLPPDFNNPFGQALVISYLYSSRNLFSKLNNNVYFIVSNNKLNYLPKENTESLNNIFDEAIKACRKILPFTPRSLLFKGLNPLFFIEIVGTGLSNTESHIYFEDDRPASYQLNKVMIDYLGRPEIIQKMEIMFPLIRICMVGNGFYSNGSQLGKITALGNSISPDQNLIFVNIENEIKLPAINDFKRVKWGNLNTLTVKEKLQKISSQAGSNISLSNQTIYCISPNILSCGTKVIDNFKNIIDSLVETCFKNEILIHPVRDELTSVAGPDSWYVFAQDNEIARGKGWSFFTTKCSSDTVVRNNYYMYTIKSINGIKIQLHHFNNLNFQKVLSKYGFLAFQDMHQPNTFYALNDIIANSLVNDFIQEFHIKDISELLLPEVPEVFYKVPIVRKQIDQWVIENSPPIGENEVLFHGDLLLQNITVYFVLGKDCHYINNQNEKSQNWNGQLNSEGSEILSCPNDNRTKDWCITQIGTGALAIAIRTTVNDNQIQEIFPTSTIEKKSGTFFSFSSKFDLIKKELQPFEKMGCITPISNWFVCFDQEKVSSIIDAIKTVLPDFNPIKENSQKTPIYGVDLSGPMITGKIDELFRLETLFANNPVDFGYKYIKVKQMKQPLKPTWILNVESRSVIVPSEDFEEAFQYYNENVHHEDHTLFCVMLCDPDPSNPYIQIYEKDGSSHLVQMCSSCVKSSLSFITKDYLKNGALKFDRILDRPSFILSEEPRETDKFSEWPQIPLGQLLYNLLSIKGYEQFIKAWVSTTIDFDKIHSGRFTSCPYHNLYQRLTCKITPMGTFYDTLTCTYPDCPMFFNPDTLEWEKGTYSKKEYHRPYRDFNLHFINLKNSKRPTYIHYCPKCNSPLVKTEGCNHIQCVCGCHWCYACPPKKSPIFKTASECYAHMTKIHGGYFTYVRY